MEASAIFRRVGSGLPDIASSSSDYIKTEKWIARLTLILGAVAALPVGWLHGAVWGAGIFIGAVLAWFNFRWLKQGLDAVNQNQSKADQMTDAFARGTPGVELPQVMLATSKASVSFHALNEVRNRLVSAYQDIMNMQL